MHRRLVSIPTSCCFGDDHSYHLLLDKEDNIKGLWADCGPGASLFAGQVTCHGKLHSLISNMIYDPFETLDCWLPEYPDYVALDFLRGIAAKIGKKQHNRGQAAIDAGLPEEPFEQYYLMTIRYVKELTWAFKTILGPEGCNTPFQDVRVMLNTYTNFPKPSFTKSFSQSLKTLDYYNFHVVQVQKNVPGFYYHYGEYPTKQEFFRILQGSGYTKALLYILIFFAWPGTLANWKKLGAKGFFDYYEPRIKQHRESLLISYL